MPNLKPHPGITGMLAWYDEPESELVECVTSAAGVLDRIVAVDGGYRLVPDARAGSPPGQVEAIRHAAAAAGIDATVVVPDDVWDGQVSKRNAMIGLALRGGAGFVMPLDADWRLRGDGPAIRHELASHPQADAFTADFYTPVPDGFDMAASPHPWHTKMAGTTVPMNLIFRAVPGLRVEHRHWWYSGLRNGHRVALWGCRGRGYRPAVTHRLQAPFRVDHVCFYRDQDRLDRNRDYTRARDAEVLEIGVET